MFSGNNSRPNSKGGRDRQQPFVPFSHPPIANAPKPDIIVIPGGNSANVYDDPEFLAWTKKAAEEAEGASDLPLVTEAEMQTPVEAGA